MELAADGVYAAQDEQLRLSLARGAGEPLSMEEALKDFQSHLNNWSVADSERPHEQRIASTFWKAIRKKL